ncbi:MAG: hypothetical protein ACRCZF_26800, partial [Gemmataceae bacterium]
MNHLHNCELCQERHTMIQTAMVHYHPPKTNLPNPQLSRRLPGRRRYLPLTLAGLGSASFAAVAMAMFQSNTDPQPGAKPAVAVAVAPEIVLPPSEQKTIPVVEQTNTFERSDQELVPGAIPGAESISMPAGPELVVIPADPNKARAERTEWRYVPIYRLDEAKYDEKTKLLTCRVDPRLSEQTKERVRQRLRKLNGAPEQTEVSLNPVRSQSLTLELTLPENKKLVLREDRAGHEIASGPVSVLYRVKDDEVHSLLTTNLKDLTLTVRSTHPYAAITRHTASVESSMTAAREATEKVLPRGMKLEELEVRPLIVDRDSALRLQQVLREEFRVRYEGNPAKLAPLVPVLDKLLARISVSDVPLHQVTSEMIDQAVMWDSKTAKLDVSPGERETMTESLKESSEKRTAFKHAWDTMRDEAKKAHDHKTWHKTLLDKMKLDARLKVGIGLFSGSASMNLEKERQESDQGSDQALRETHEKMKNAGEMTQENFEKTYREFKGKDWAKSAAGKILNLQRVTSLNATAFRRAMVEWEERWTKGMMERVTLLPMIPSTTLQADSLQEIAELRKLLVQQETEFQAQLRTLRTAHVDLASDVETQTKL